MVAPVGANLRLKIVTWRQIDLFNSFQHLLAIPVIDRAGVGNHDRERRKWTLAADTSYAAFPTSESDRHMLLHLLTGASARRGPPCFVMFIKIPVHLRTNSIRSSSDRGSETREFPRLLLELDHDRVPYAGFVFAQIGTEAGGSRHAREARCG